MLCLTLTLQRQQTPAWAKASDGPSARPQDVVADITDINGAVSDDIAELQQREMLRRSSVPSSVYTPIRR